MSLQPRGLQAGVSLGLTDEIVAKFPVWGHKLQAPALAPPLTTAITTTLALALSLALSLP